jgi:hypothetical protein
MRALFLKILRYKVHNNMKAVVVLAILALFIAINAQTKSKTIQVLEKAAKGLEIMSESDYPFDAFELVGVGHIPLNNKTLLKLTNNDPKSLVEEVSLFWLLQYSMEEEEWKEKGEAKRFRNLFRTILKTLRNVRVFRVGEVEIKVLVIGNVRGNEMNYAGYNTTLIET